VRNLNPYNIALIALIAMPIIGGLLLVGYMSGEWLALLASLGGIVCVMSFIGSLIWLMEKAYNYDRAKEAMTIKKAANDNISQ
jgi:hypothetical protein